MSLRKVSDLQGLTITDVLDNGLSDNLMNSLFEISYLSTIEPTVDLPPRYMYVSMFTTYADIRNDLLSAILSSGSTIEFHDHLDMLCGLCLSGNFYMNMEMDDSELTGGNREYGRGTGYEMFIHTTQNTLCAIYGPNLFFSSESNILQSNNNIIKDADGNIIAQFGATQIEFNQPLSVNADIYTTGDVHGNTFHGIALSARWADVAELYESDHQYEPGTLVKFGGNKEITIADTEANAVVTYKPGIVLNKSRSKTKDAGKVAIALVGRTPVKVLGKIHKFGKLMLSTIPGVATSKDDVNKKTIAIAMEDKYKDEIGLVECVVKMEF